MPFGEIDLVPLEIDGLGHPQAMPSHEQDQCGVTLPITTLTRRFDELAELALAQVFRAIAAVHRCPRGLTFRKSPLGSLIRELAFATHSGDQAQATFRRV